MLPSQTYLLLLMSLLFSKLTLPKVIKHAPLRTEPEQQSSSQIFNVENDQVLFRNAYEVAALSFSLNTYI